MAKGKRHGTLGLGAELSSAFTTRVRNGSGEPTCWIADGVRSRRRLPDDAWEPLADRRSVNSASASALSNRTLASSSRRFSTANCLTRSSDVLEFVLRRDEAGLSARSGEYPVRSFATGMPTASAIAKRLGSFLGAAAAATEVRLHAASNCAVNFDTFPAGACTVMEPDDSVQPPDVCGGLKPVWLFSSAMAFGIYHWPLGLDCRSAAADANSGQTVRTFRLITYRGVDVDDR